MRGRGCGAGVGALTGGAGASARTMLSDVGAAGFRNRHRSAGCPRVSGNASTGVDAAAACCSRQRLVRARRHAMCKQCAAAGAARRLRARAKGYRRQVEGSIEPQMLLHTSLYGAGIWTCFFRWPRLTARSGIQGSQGQQKAGRIALQTGATPIGSASVQCARLRPHIGSQRAASELASRSLNTAEFHK